MPRRNHREAYEPLDLTKADIKAPVRRIGDQWTPYSEKERRAQREREAARRRRQADARLDGGIDWAVCLVPGCIESLHGMRAERQKDWRDHRANLPLCITHLATAYAQAVPNSTDQLLVEALTQVLEHRAAKALSTKEASKKAWLTKTDGDIYYVRLNGLIKVGWTRDILDRLRAYGPSVEVLVVHEGTRDDETNLHRQLKPARARGHEWYEDGPILAHFIARALEQHGPPSKDLDSWTKPKQIVAGKRIKRSV